MCQNSLVHIALLILHLYSFGICWWSDNCLYIWVGVVCTQWFLLNPDVAPDVNVLFRCPYVNSPSFDVTVTKMGPSALHKILPKRFRDRSYYFICYTLLSCAIGPFLQQESTSSYFSPLMSCHLMTPRDQWVRAIISQYGVIYILRNHRGGGVFRNDYANVIFTLQCRIWLLKGGGGLETDKKW